MSWHFFIAWHLPSLVGTRGKVVIGLAAEVLHHADKTRMATLLRLTGSEQFRGRCWPQKGKLVCQFPERCMVHVQFSKNKHVMFGTICECDVQKSGILFKVTRKVGQIQPDWNSKLSTTGNTAPTISKIGQYHGFELKYRTRMFRQDNVDSEWHLTQHWSNTTK